MNRRRIGSPIALVLSVLVAAVPVVLGADEGTVSGTVRISPIRVSLGVSETSLTTGKTFRATASVHNIGNVPVGDIVVRLRLDPAGLAVSKPGDRLIAQIKGGRNTSVTWTVCAVSPGTYVLLGQATVGGSTVESGAVVVAVAAGRRSC